MTGGDWRRWEQRYLDGAAGWERKEANPAYLAWRAAGIPSPGRVLIPCAGRSVEPALLAQAGFDVTVLDFAPAAIAAQREALRDFPATFAQADLFAWQPQDVFDAIYDQTALCALPPERHPEYEALLHAWLRPGGQLMILFMHAGRPGGPPFDCPIDRMRHLFSPERWTWPDRLEPVVAHPIGYPEQPVILTRLA